MGLVNFGGINLHSHLDYHRTMHNYLSLVSAIDFIFSDFMMKPFQSMDFTQSLTYYFAIG
jgi:hypothetical protein